MANSVFFAKRRRDQTTDSLGAGWSIRLGGNPGVERNQLIGLQPNAKQGARLLWPWLSRDNASCCIHALVITLVRPGGKVKAPRAGLTTIKGRTPMTTANSENTTTELPYDRIMTALMTMEDRIIMIKNVDGILCHVIASSAVIQGEDLCPLSELLVASHKSLEEDRMTVWAAVREIQDAHKAELARFREELAPMSGRNVEGMRRFLRIAAENTLKTLDDLDAALATPAG